MTRVFYSERIHKIINSQNMIEVDGKKKVIFVSRQLSPIASNVAKVMKYICLLLHDKNRSQ